MSNSVKRNIKYKCPYCDKRFTREDLVHHIEDEHEDMIPEGYSALRLVFNYVNKKPIEYNGKCTECGGETGFDEKTGRYRRQCQNPACKASFIKNFESNMLRTKGVTRISSTAEGQEKMLANRKISGKYKFKNGEEKTYTGSYELNALKFMDQVMDLNPDDIMCPGPVLEYEYNGKKHLYITDFYYQPYNLIIEVKDGGSRPNNRSMPEYRAKQVEKEKFIIKNTNYNYLRLTDNDLSQLLSVFADLKMQLVENTGERVIHVNENVNILNESSLKSNIDKDFKPKGKKQLSEFKKIIGSKETIDKYKKEYKFLRHIDYHDDVYLWLDGEKLVGAVAVDKKEDCYWITAIELTKEYQGYGLGNQLLDYAVKNMHASALTVAKNNNIAKNMYLKYGFKISGKESKDKQVYYMYLNASLSEAINALLTGYIPGVKDTGSVYIVNYMKNNVFSGEIERGYGISDNCKLTNLITRNKSGILDKAPDNFLENATYDVYLTNKSIEEVSEKLSPYIGEFVEEGFLYEILFNKKMYTYDQIATESSIIPCIDYYKGMELFRETVDNFILGKSKSSDCLAISEGTLISEDFDLNNKDMSVISYTSIKDGTFRVESTDYPELGLETDKLNEKSIESNFLKSLLVEVK